MIKINLIIKFGSGIMQNCIIVNCWFDDKEYVNEDVNERLFVYFGG